PPGLARGWHQIRLLTADVQSNPVPIAVGLPLVADFLVIQSVCDGVDWGRNRISLRNGVATIWLRGLPRNADVNNVKIALGGKRLFTTFVSAPDAGGISQVNARLPAATPE